MHFISSLIFALSNELLLFFVSDNVQGDNTFANSPIEMPFPSSKYT